MEELDLQDLFKYYLKRIPIILTILVIVIFVGYFYVSFIKTPLYNAKTTIILVQKQNEEITSANMQSSLSINEKLVTTYSELIKSRRVLQQVKNSLGLDMSISELADNITVNSVKETSIIKITVSSENNHLSVKIANKVASIFKQEISKIYDLENISVIDEASLEEEPYNINLLKELFIYSLIAIVVSCGIIFVIYYFDNKIKNKKEIETKLNLPVLGEIPIISFQKEGME